MAGAHRHTEWLEERTAGGWSIELCRKAEAEGTQMRASDSGGNTARGTTREKGAGWRMGLADWREEGGLRGEGGTHDGREWQRPRGGSRDAVVVAAQRHPRCGGGSHDAAPARALMMMVSSIMMMMGVTASWRP